MATYNAIGISMMKKKFEVSPERSGVYYLIKNDAVRYVGQSKNVYTRVLSHKRHEYDKIEFLPMPKSTAASRRRLEAKEIARLMPEENNRMKQKHLALAGKLKKAIVDSGVKQNHIASEVGMHPALLSRYINGKRVIPHADLVAVLSAIGKPLSTVIG